MERTVTLEEIEGRTVSDLLREIVRERESLRVVLEGGEIVAIVSTAPQVPRSEKTNTPLKPLPQLKGTVPAGWKEAIYEIDAARQ